MSKFIYDIIPPGIKKTVESVTREVSKWIKILTIFLKTSKYGSVVLVIVVVGFGAILVWAFSPEAQTVEIFPTQYETDIEADFGWKNGDMAFQKELSKEASLAEFSSENSAVLFEKISSNSLMPVDEESKTTESFIEEPAIEEPKATPSENLEEDLIILKNLFKTAIGGDPGQETIEPLKQPLEQTAEPLVEQIEQLPEETPKESEPALDVSGTEGEIKGEEIEIESTEDQDMASDAEELLNLIEEVEEVPSVSEQILTKHSIIFTGFSADQLGDIERASLMFSWAAERRSTNEILIVDYRMNSDSEWKTLTLIQLGGELSNLFNAGYTGKKIPEISSSEDLGKLEVRFTVQSINAESQLPIYLDAVWLDVEYMKPENGEVLGARSIEDEYDFELLSNKKDFKINDHLEFKFLLKKKTNKNILLSLISSESTNIKATVINKRGEISTDFIPQIQEQIEDEFWVVLNTKNPNQFHPGEYLLKIEIENDEGVFVGEQKFTLGVLAINTNKSIYLPNEQAYLQMAALKDDGHTLCDANLRLEIFVPNGGVVNPEIQKSGKCGPNNVVDVPDYFAHYRVNGAGAYQMKLKNLDTGYEIIDSFEVRESVPFEVERVGATRIYPLASYGMTLKIKANQDFIGEVAETVPDGFEVKSQNAKTRITDQNSKIISWDVDWKAGETYELKYEFDAPDVSPYLYLLGPLKIGDPSASLGQVFQETRKWQIASDATTTKQFIISGTADDPSTSATEYSNLMGDGNYVWAAEVGRKALIPTPGKLSNFKVQVKTAPAAGKSWTFAVRINGSATNLSVTISDTNVISSLDTDEVVVAAGDDTSISATPSGTPTAAAAVYWTAQFTPDTSGETILLGSSNGTTFTNNNYRALVGTKANTATEFDTQIVFPTSGTLKKLYLELSAAPGGVTSKALVVRKNGVDTSLVATVSGTNTTGNDTSNPVSITAGDKVTYRQSVTGTPASSYEFYGIVFVPDTPGEYIAAATTNNITDSTSVEYQHLTCGLSTLSTTENEYYNLAQETTAKAIYVNLGTAPASGNTWTFTLRDDTANTSLVVSISNTATSGNFATDVLIGADSVLDTAIDATAGSATSTTQISYLFYNAPVGNTPPTINEVSLNSKQAINLLEGSTIDISASVSVTDVDNGDCSDISGVKAIVYRYSTYTASCSNDPNNCYDEDNFNCAADGACSGNTQNYNCYASSSMQFFTDPTSAGSSYSADEWVVSIIASDSAWADVASNSYDDDNETDVEVNELSAIEVTAGGTLNYGEVIVGQNTGAINQTVTIKNTGNNGADVYIQGTNLSGACGTIAVNNQQYASASFTYGDYGTVLTGSNVRYYNGAISWIKPTSATPITNNIYWGINIPVPTGAGTCSGTNTFSATSEQ